MVDKELKIVFNFSEHFKIKELGSITQTKIETVFKEDDFLAYAVAAAKEALEEDHH